MSVDNGARRFSKARVTCLDWSRRHKCCIVHALLIYQRAVAEDKLHWIHHASPVFKCSAGQKQIKTGTNIVNNVENGCNRDVGACRKKYLRLEGKTNRPVHSA